MSLNSKAHIVYLNEQGVQTAIAALNYLGSVADDTARDNLGGLIAGSVVSVTNSAASNNTPAIYHYNGTSFDTLGSAYIVNAVATILADRYSGTQIDTKLTQLGIYPPVASVPQLSGIAAPTLGYICAVASGTSFDLYRYQSGGWVKVLDKDVHTNITQLLADVVSIQATINEVKYWKSPVADLTALAAIPSPLAGEFRLVLDAGNGNAVLYKYSTQWEAHYQTIALPAFSQLATYPTNNSPNQIVFVVDQNSFYHYNVASTSWVQIGGGSSGTYTNTNATPSTVGGIAAGSTFSNKTQTQMWNDLLYPYTLPLASFSLDTPLTLERGATISSLTFTASVTPKSNTVTTVEYYVGGVLKGTDTVSFSSGTQTLTKTFTFSTPLASSGSTLSTTSTQIKVIDNIGGTTTVTNNISWKTKLFFFVDATDYISTTQTDAAISTVLNGKSASSYDFANSTRVRTGDTFTPSTQYIYYVWQQSFGSAIPPVAFTVNGLPNTAWETRIVSYTNSEGFTSSVVIFRSEFQLNSTFNINVQ